MKAPKLQFSDAEADLMCNAEIILTKNKIILAIKKMMENLQEEMVDTKFNSHLDQEFFANSVKISKGENYLGLPYLVLDYPRLFLKENVFAVRTMFWWGHFFSTTLHIAGESKENFQRKIETAYISLAQNEFYVGINDDAWEHHFEETNYQKINRMSEKGFSELLQNLPHIKIAASLPINKWQNAADTLLENWKFLLRLCFD